mmetsp:Transcript_474/g.946  ORF Transcript_474/g.946 Transcript_474/m.946 type:complete len:242 (+) Transcript_474:260-985(+)
MVGLRLVPNDAKPVDERPLRLAIGGLLDEHRQGLHPLKAVPHAQETRLSGFIARDDMLCNRFELVHIVEIHIASVHEQLHEPRFPIHVGLVLLALLQSRGPVEPKLHEREVDLFLEENLQQQLWVCVGGQRLVLRIRRQHLEERRMIRTAVQGHSSRLVDQVGANHEINILVPETVPARFGLGHLERLHPVRVGTLIVDALHPPSGCRRRPRSDNAEARRPVTKIAAADECPNGRIIVKLT